LFTPQWFAVFDFLKRWASPPPPPAARRSSAGKSQRSARSKAASVSAPLPLPVPEVIEGNEDTDWALWEDSVSQPLSPRDSVYDRLAPSSQFNDVDAFGSVRKRDK
jgi:hypothetical protein